MNEHGDSHGVRGRRPGNGQLGRCGNGADGMHQSKAAPWQTRPERARALGKKKLTSGTQRAAAQRRGAGELVQLSQVDAVRSRSVSYSPYDRKRTVEIVWPLGVGRTA